MGMNSPARHYASGFSKTTYFVADESHGGNAFDTSGAFTVCAKVKPGANPEMTGANKIFVAKGQAEGTDPTYLEGWALMQMHMNFCFHYRTLLDTEMMSYFDTVYVETVAQDRSFDYICGGRTGSGTGSTIWVNGHGLPEVGLTQAMNGTFASPSSLPLSIGAYPTGDNPHADGGVYEVIWDSRPMSAAVAEEIVQRSSLEIHSGWSGRLFSTLNQFDSQIVTTTSEKGADLATYVFPPFVPGFPTMDYVGGTIPGNGGFIFKTPVVTDTTVSGFCLGAELSSDWGGASTGTLIQFATNDAFTEASDIRMDANNYYFTTSHAGPGFASGYAQRTGIEKSWLPGSRHKFIGCISPTDNVLKLYIDGGTTNVLIPLPPPAVPGIPQLNTAGGWVTIGPSLVGGNALIYRGFICTDPSNCN
jgi:hypothetical protein